MTYRLIVLIGGSGSNLQALIDHAKAHAHFEVAGVISHNADAYGLERARLANIPTRTIAHQDYAQRAHFEADLTKAIHAFSPDGIALAGFMRILSAPFVDSFHGKIINIHPSLLPKFPGLNTHQKVLDAGDAEHGATIHFVTPELDGGPLIAQTKVPVLKSDTVTSLAQRVLQAEHWLYPQVVTWLAQNRLNYDGKIVTLDNKPVPASGLSLTSDYARTLS